MYVMLKYSDMFIQLIQFIQFFQSVEFIRFIRFIQLIQFIQVIQSIQFNQFIRLIQFIQSACTVGPIVHKSWCSQFFFVRNSGQYNTLKPLKPYFQYGAVPRFQFNALLLLLSLASFYLFFEKLCRKCFFRLFRGSNATF